VFEVEQATTIGAAAEEEWDSLAESNPLASHAWLRSIEQSSPLGQTQCYLFARDSAGLAAAFECGLEMPAHPFAALGEFLFGRGAGIARATWMPPLPAVVVRKRICRPGLPDNARRSLDESLVEALERLAGERRATICFRKVTQEDSTLVELLRARGYASSIDFPLARLDVSADWRSFADYRRHVKRLHPGMESSIRRELNHAKKHGLAIETVDDSKHFSRLYRLLNDHFLRLNHRPFPYDAGIFERLKANLGERLVISMATMQDEPIGVLVGIRSGSSIAFPLIGIDQERGRVAATYFNLAYNRNIERCIEQGVRLVYFGTLAYRTKVQRGCRLIPSHLYVRCQSAIGQRILRPLLDLRSARMRDKFGPAQRGMLERRWRA
jgi:predicted N-acyltransferase